MAEDTTEDTTEGMAEGMTEGMTEDICIYLAFSIFFPKAATPIKVQFIQLPKQSPKESPNSPLRTGKPLNAPTLRSMVRTVEGGGTVHRAVGIHGDVTTAVTVLMAWLLKRMVGLMKLLLLLLLHRLLGILARRRHKPHYPQSASGEY